MPRAHTLSESVHFAGAALHSDSQTGTALSCGQCRSSLECVDQNRRSGTWLGSFICPNCRSEYFYAYRWGRLMRKS